MKKGRIQVWKTNQTQLRLVARYRSSTDVHFTLRQHRQHRRCRSSLSSLSRSFSSPRRREQRRQSVPAAGQIHAIKTNGRCPEYLISPFMRYNSHSTLTPELRIAAKIRPSLTEAYGYRMQAPVCHAIDNGRRLDLSSIFRCRRVCGRA